MGGDITPSEWVIEHPHKEEKKEKENKKEKKGMTNFDLLIDNLPSNYKTPERIDYIKNKYNDRLNEADLTGGVLDSWVINIKNELNQQFPINYIIPKEEPKSNTIDMF